MAQDDRQQTAAEMSAQAKKAQQIIADAEKNGYLPKIELDAVDQWDIEHRQTSLEKRIAAKTEVRNQEYLQDRERWGKRYAKPRDFNFGNWSKQNCDNYTIRAACADKSLSPAEQLENRKKLAKITEDMAYLNTSHLHNKFDWKLKDSDIVHTNKGEDSAYEPLAYNFSKQTLFINDQNLESAKNKKYKPIAEAAKGNPAALNCVLYHELNHKQNWEHDGLGKLSYTPINAAKGVVLTEKISLCTEYLTMAKEYNDRKAKGDKTIKYADGTEKPLDSLLEIYPGFKEVAEKYGTDINNPATKREFVKTAMNYWENDRGKEYNFKNEPDPTTGRPKESITIDEARWGSNYFNQCSFTKQAELLRDEEKTYNDVSSAMMRDINIGGQKMDLSDCKDLVDTFSTQEVQKILTEHNNNDTYHSHPITLPSQQEYQQINQYLESIGKKTDAEKMEHLSKTIQAAGTSAVPYDKNLETIMMRYNDKITSESLNIERKENTVVASFADKKYDITEYATPAKANENQKTSTLTTQQLLNQQKQR